MLSSIMIVDLMEKQKNFVITARVIVIRELLGLHFTYCVYHFALQLLNCDLCNDNLTIKMHLVVM